MGGGFVGKADRPVNQLGVVKVMSRAGIAHHASDCTVVRYVRNKHDVFATGWLCCTFKSGTLLYWQLDSGLF